MTIRLSSLLLVVLTVSIVACGSTVTESDEEIVQDAEKEQVLRIYNWDTYIDPQILEEFEREFNVSIDYQVFDSDDDLLEELREGSNQYDVVVPSDFIVSIMRAENLLVELNIDNIPNFKNIDSAFVGPVFDPANRYCMPYQWGTVGIGYNIATTGKEIKSWADLFDPVYTGRVALLNDARTMMGVVLIMLGYSPNTTDSGQIAQAAEFLNNQSGQIGGYVGDDGQDLLDAGDYDMVVEWSGDIFQLMEENPDIRYVIPEEGSIIWTDNICVPVNAPEKELAERFINYILEPSVGAALSNYIQYGSPNRASLPMINVEDLNNPAIYPSDEIRQRLFFLVDVNLVASEIYDQLWEQVLIEHGS